MSPLRSVLPALAVLVGCARHTVLIGAGDIAICDSPNDEATATLADSLRAASRRAGRNVLLVTAGDNVYPRGTPERYESCHRPSWGRRSLFQLTRPAPGNHDYLADSTAGPYFAYFGARAGPSGLGYYSYEAGAWHLISLNSELRDSAAAAAQAEWLRADLARHRHARCTLAYWHKPVFSSGLHGNVGTMAWAWPLLYEAGAEVILGGHDHTYERFAPQTPAGVLDSIRGVRQFVVGTGGAGPYEFTHLGQAPNSEHRLTGRYGVLLMELLDGSYRWAFVTVDGQTLDAGAAPCH